MPFTHHLLFELQTLLVNLGISTSNSPVLLDSAIERLYDLNVGITPIRREIRVADIGQVFARFTDGFRYLVASPDHHRHVSKILNPGTPTGTCLDYSANPCSCHKRKLSTRMRRG